MKIKKKLSTFIDRPFCCDLASTPHMTKNNAHHQTLGNSLIDVELLEDLVNEKKKTRYESDADDH